MEYWVEITEDFVVQVQFPPNAPTPKSIDLHFEVNTPAELRTMVDRLGFNVGTMDATNKLHMRYGLPVTRDGVRVARCTVHLWLGKGLTDRPADPPIPALVALKEAAGAVAADV